MKTSGSLFWFAWIRILVQYSLVPTMVLLIFTPGFSASKVAMMILFCSTMSGSHVHQSRTISLSVAAASLVPAANRVPTIKSTNRIVSSFFIQFLLLCYEILISKAQASCAVSLTIRCFAKPCSKRASSPLYPHVTR